MVKATDVALGKEIVAALEKEQTFALEKEQVSEWENGRAAVA